MTALADDAFSAIQYTKENGELCTVYVAEIRLKIKNLVGKRRVLIVKPTPEVASADAGVAITLKKINSGGTTTLMTVTSTPSATLYSIEYYSNDTDFVSVDLRALAIADTIEIGHAGGKTGTGEVRVILSMIKVLR